VVTRRLQAERRTGSVCRPKTGILPTVLRNQPVKAATLSRLPFCFVTVPYCSTFFSTAVTFLRIQKINTGIRCEVDVNLYMRNNWFCNSGSTIRCSRFLLASYKIHRSPQHRIPNNLIIIPEWLDIITALHCQRLSADEQAINTHIQNCFIGPL